VVITEAGNDPKVAALVYIAAFAPDKGESVATLTDLRPGVSVSPVLPPRPATGSTSRNRSQWLRSSQQAESAVSATR
jgi:hypothetical protein